MMAGGSASFQADRSRRIEMMNARGENALAAGVFVHGG
jgi:hypothetical protein